MNGQSLETSVFTQERLLSNQKVERRAKGNPEKLLQASFARIQKLIEEKEKEIAYLVQLKTNLTVKDCQFWGSK